MLVNESEHILRGDQAIYLAGIDDAHYYRVDNIEKAASEIPDNGFSILLSLPRHMGSGPWKHRDMMGYTSVGVGTSVVPVRFNCLPEITLHHLQCSAGVTSI